MADRNGYIGRAPGDSAVTVARQTFSPTGVTTDFTFASGYTSGYFDVFINGVKMIEGSDYTSTDGSTFSILNGGATSGDVIEGVAYKAFNAATATVGVNSAGTPIGSVNTLNFVGTGNTFALRGSSIDISISGGGAGAGGTWANYDTNTGVSTTKKVKIENDLEVTGVTTSTGGFVGNVTGTATGLSGSPNITINNLTGVAATFTGVLTYEDVTNVDSLGLGTFRNGLIVQGTGTTSTTLNVSGVSTFVGFTTFQDNVFVAGVSTLTGNAFVGSAVSIYASSGIVSATSFYGDGSNLSNIVSGVTLEQAGSSVGSAITTINFASSATLTTASSGFSTVTISAGIQTEAGTASGIVTHVRLSSAQDHKITATGFTTITSSGSGTEGDSHTIRIVNSGIATVGFSTYFLFPSGAAPSLPTADGAISLISFTVHDSVGAGCTQLLAGASVNYS